MIPLLVLTVYVAAMLALFYWRSIRRRLTGSDD